MVERILITGGCGFIGTHLVRRLARDGKAVRVLDLVTPHEFFPGVEYVKGDVRDPQCVAKAVRGVSAVFHFAAIVGVSVCQQNPYESYGTNLQGTLEVLEAVRVENQKRDRPIRLFFSSTAAVYGNRGQLGFALAEADVSDEPLSYYAAQKMSSEHAIRLYRDVHGVPAVVFRFFNVYGPGQDPASPYAGVISIFGKALKNKDPLTLFGGGVQTRDFLSVHDVVNACVMGLGLKDADCDGRPINLGTGLSISVRELAALMGRIQGCTVSVNEAPFRSGDVLHSQSDIARANRVLGWTPKLALQAGLEELFASEKQPAYI